MTQNAFGWIDQGRRSEECRKATVRALLRALPYIAALLLLAVVWQAATASTTTAPQPTRNAQVIALVGALVGACVGLGIVIGRALEARRSERACSVCSNLHTAEGAARLDLKQLRRVRAGAALPCSYSSEHPEQTLRALRRRAASTTRS